MGFLPIVKVFYVFHYVKGYGIPGKPLLRRRGGVIYKKYKQTGQMLISLAKAGRCHRNASVLADL